MNMDKFGDPPSHFNDTEKKPRDSGFLDSSTEDSCPSPLMPLCPQEFGAFLKSKPPSALLASSELDSQSSTSTSLPVCSSPSIRVKSEPKTSQASDAVKVPRCVRSPLPNTAKTEQITDSICPTVPSALKEMHREIVRDRKTSKSFNNSRLSASTVSSFSPPLQSKGITKARITAAPKSKNGFSVRSVPYSSKPKSIPSSLPKGITPRIAATPNSKNGCSVRSVPYSSKPKSIPSSFPSTSDNVSRAFKGIDDEVPFELNTKSTPKVRKEYHHPPADIQDPLPDINYLVNFHNHNSKSSFGDATTPVFTASVIDAERNVNIQESDGSKGSIEKDAVKEGGEMPFIFFLKCMEEKSESAAKLIAANEKIAELAVQFVESKEEQIDELKQCLRQVHASISVQIEQGIKNYMNSNAGNRPAVIGSNRLPPQNPPHQADFQNQQAPPAEVVPPIPDVIEGPEVPWKIPPQNRQQADFQNQQAPPAEVVPPTPDVNEGVYPFDEEELDQMACNVSATDFIRKLMRKLFTEHFLATESITTMEKAHQTAIIGATLRRYRMVKKGAVLRLVDGNYVKREMANVFACHRVKKKKQQK